MQTDTDIASWRVAMLRTGYGIAALGGLALAVLAASGGMNEVFDGGTRAAHAIAQLLGAMTAICLAVGVCLFVFLAFRPYWWGKLFCLAAATSWLGFGAQSYFAFGAPTVAAVALAAGLAVLLAGLLHQIADPRFSGPYLRPA